MNRIDSRLRQLHFAKEKSLALFITAGFPRYDSTPQLVHHLEAAGADIIELGMPFSDPLADGPVIQQSSSLALKNGVTLESIFADVRRIRTQSEIPILLMGYLNPIMRYGEERFFSYAHECGVDGVILPEVPMEESQSFSDLCRKHGLAHIFLVAPTSTNERIALIDNRSTGFLYCVSTTGVTGAISAAPAVEYIRRVKQSARCNPVLVGFGISAPNEARSAAVESDGVIVGSALIKKLMSDVSVPELKGWVREIKSALG